MRWTFFRRKINEEAHCSAHVCGHPDSIIQKGEAGVIVVEVTHKDPTRSLDELAIHDSVKVKLVNGKPVIANKNPYL